MCADEVNDEDEAPPTLTVEPIRGLRPQLILHQENGLLDLKGAFQGLLTRQIRHE
jgi:hypothetical protein